MAQVLFPAFLRVLREELRTECGAQAPFQW